MDSVLHVFGYGYVYHIFNQDDVVWISPNGSEDPFHADISFVIRHVVNEDNSAKKWDDQANIDGDISLSWIPQTAPTAAKITVSQSILGDIEKLKPAFTAFVGALDNLNSGKFAYITPGATRVISATLAEALPMPISEIPFFHFGLSNNKAGNFVSLSAGMSLEIVHSNFYDQQHQGTGQQTQRFCGTGTEEIDISSVAGTNDTVFNVFLSKQQAKVSNQNAHGMTRLATHVLDLAGNFNKQYQRLFYPGTGKSISSVTKPGVDIESCPVLQQAASYDNLGVMPTTKPMTSKEHPPELNHPIRFFGRAVAIPKFLATVNGGRQHVPVGTTIRNLVEADATVGTIPQQFELKRYHKGVATKVTIEPSLPTDTLLDLPLVKGDQVRWYPQDAFALVERAQAVYRVLQPHPTAEELVAEVFLSFGKVDNDELPDANDMAVALKQSHRHPNAYSVAEIARALHVNYRREPFADTPLTDSQLAFALYFAGFDCKDVALGVIAVVKRKITKISGDILVTILILSGAGYSVKQLAQAVFNTVDGSRDSNAPLLVTSLVLGAINAHRTITSNQVAFGVYNAVGYTPATADHLAYALKAGTIHSGLTAYSVDQVAEGVFTAFRDSDHSVVLTIDQLAAALAFAQQPGGYSVREVAQGTFKVLGKLTPVVTPTGLAQALHHLNSDENSATIYDMNQVASGVNFIQDYGDPFSNPLSAQQLAQALRNAFTSKFPVLATCENIAIAVSSAKGFKDSDANALTITQALADTFKYPTSSPTAQNLAAIARGLSAVPYAVGNAANSIKGVFSSISGRQLATALMEAYNSPPLTPAEMASALKVAFDYNSNVQKDLDDLTKALLDAFDTRKIDAVIVARAIGSAYPNFAKDQKHVGLLAHAFSNAKKKSDKSRLTHGKAALALWSVFHNQFPDQETGFEHIGAALKAAYPQLDPSEIDAVAADLVDVFSVGITAGEAVPDLTQALFNIFQLSSKNTGDAETLAGAVANHFTGFTNRISRNAKLLARSLKQNGFSSNSTMQALHTVFHKPAISPMETAKVILAVFPEIKIDRLAVQLVETYNFKNSQQDQINTITFALGAAEKLKNNVSGSTSLSSALIAAFKLSEIDVATAASMLGQALFFQNISLINSAVSIHSELPGIDIYQLAAALTGKNAYKLTTTPDQLAQVLAKIFGGESYDQDVLNALSKVLVTSFGFGDTPRDAIAVAQATASCFKGFSDSSENAAPLSRALKAAQFSYPGTILALAAVFPSLTFLPVVDIIVRTYQDTKSDPEGTIKTILLALRQNRATQNNIDAVAIALVSPDGFAFGNAGNQAAIHVAQIIGQLFPVFVQNPADNSIMLVAAMKKASFEFESNCTAVFKVFAGPQVETPDLCFAICSSYPDQNINTLAKLIVSLYGFSASSSPDILSLTSALQYGFSLGDENTDAEKLALAVGKAFGMQDDPEGMSPALAQALAAGAYSDRNIGSALKVVFDSITAAEMALALEAGDPDIPIVKLAGELRHLFNYSATNQEDLNQLVFALRSSFGSLVGATEIARAIAQAIPSLTANREKNAVRLAKALSQQRVGFAFRPVGVAIYNVFYSDAAMETEFAHVLHSAFPSVSENELAIAIADIFQETVMNQEDINTLAFALFEITDGDADQKAKTMSAAIQAVFPKLHDSINNATLLAVALKHMDFGYGSLSKGLRVVYPRMSLDQLALTLSSAFGARPSQIGQALIAFSQTKLSAKRVLQVTLRATRLNLLKHLDDLALALATCGFPLSDIVSALLNSDEDHQIAVVDLIRTLQKLDLPDATGPEKAFKVIRAIYDYSQKATSTGISTEDIIGGFNAAYPPESLPSKINVEISDLLWGLD